MKLLTCTVTAFLLLAFTPFLQAQKGYELGVQFNSLNNYSAIFKKQLKNPNRYFRLTSGLIQATGGSNNNGVNFRVGLGVGIETRREINERFKTYWGPSLNSFSTVAYIENVDSWDVAWSNSLGFFLGGQYWFHSNFYASLEVHPQLLFSHDFTSRQTQVAFNGNVTNARLGVFYAF